MHQESKHSKIKDLEELCRSRGIPLTWQRRAVLEVLTSRLDHPTADQIYAEARSRVPEISRTTVYRSLEILASLGIIAKAAHPGAASRFDAVTDRHHHLLCKACGRLEDVPSSEERELSMNPLDSRGFRIDDYSIYFRGLCADCATTGATAPSGSGRASRKKSTSPKGKTS